MPPVGPSGVEPALEVVDRDDRLTFHRLAAFAALERWLERGDLEESVRPSSLEASRRRGAGLVVVSDS